MIWGYAAPPGGQAAGYGPYRVSKMIENHIASANAINAVSIANNEQINNFVYKIFTFWFRPLFFDGLGVLGFLASFENLFCLIMAFQIIKWLIKSWSGWNGYFKISLFAFLLGSVILAQITGNLGIALRQKAQLMPFFFILYLKALSLNLNNKKISKL